MATQMDDSQPKPKKDFGPVWTNYRVQWDFTGRLCGSTPQQADLIEGWLDARQPSVRPPSSRSMREVQEEVLASLAVVEDDSGEVEQRVTLGFQTDQRRLVMRGGTMRAHLKDCARILSSLYVGKIQGEKSFAVKVVNSVYVDEYWVPILRANGEPVVEADGTFDKTVRVTTPMGPRSAIKRIEYIQAPRLVFTLKVLANAVKLEDLTKIMEYGATHGYAGERSDGEGRYLFTITPMA